MRNTFIDELVLSARINKNIALIVGDLGYNVVEPFANEFPERFINAGVAEQNMTGLAAGLASEGYHVFTYSIANFPTFRCAEQIRNDIDYHNLPVTVVSVGGGLSYGNLGYSHHAIQDFGLIRIMPNMLIVAPGDPIETRDCLRYLVENPQPSYLRLKKAGEPIFCNKNQIINPGNWNEVIAPKNDKIFLTTGGGLQIAHKLKESRIEYKEYGIYTCPIWGASLKQKQQEFINKFDEIITVEDHLADCGFGSWLRESISLPESHLKIKVKALSLEVIGKVGSEEYLLYEAGRDSY
jgi:transketolase